MFILHTQAKSKQISHAADRMGPGWSWGKRYEKRLHSLYIHISKSVPITDAGCGQAALGSCAADGKEGGGGW